MSAARTRTRAALAAGSALVLALVIILVVRDDSSERVDPYLQFMTAHLDVVSAQPEEVSPDARFTRTIYRETDLDGVEPALDACAGPVAVDLGADHPTLVVEHDYCGGLAWMPKLKRTDVVKLKGPGIEPGFYAVERIKHVPRYTSKVDDLPESHTVLQTCISRTTMVLVGLRPVTPATA